MLAAISKLFAGERRRTLGGMSVESARRVTWLILAKCVARVENSMRETEKIADEAPAARFAGPAQLGEWSFSGFELLRTGPD